MKASRSLKACFELKDGFPRPKWEQLAEYVRSQCKGQDENTISIESALQWLERLKSHLGGSYEVYETDNCLLLSSLDPQGAQRLLSIAERTLEFLSKALTGFFSRSGHGKIVLLSFFDEQQYYKYISHFYKEGEYGGSGGLFIAECYSHCVLNAREESDTQRTVVHELTHALLHKHGLPQWIEEGISQVVEGAVLPGIHFMVTREDVRNQQRFWKKYGLDDFWSGRSFHRPDKSQSLSYMLSQVLIRNMLAGDRRQFMHFLERATAEDYGEEASRRAFGLTLGDWVLQFLGEGNWEPTLKTAEEFYNRALFRQRQEQYDQALHDYRKAIAQDKKCPEPYQAMAWLLSTCRQDDIRNGDKAVPFATKACELTHWKSADSLDTLAAAYAGRGEFDMAIKWAEKAVAVATAEKKKAIEARLKRYRTGIPYLDVGEKQERFFNR